MSIYQPNLTIFNARIIRNEQGGFTEILSLTRRDPKGKEVKASKRDEKRLHNQLYKGIKT